MPQAAARLVYHLRGANSMLGSEPPELRHQEFEPRLADEWEFAPPLVHPDEIDVPERERLVEPGRLEHDLAERVDDVRAAPEREAGLRPDAVHEDDVALQHARVEARQTARIALGLGHGGRNGGGGEAQTGARGGGGGGGGRAAP